MAQVKPVNKKKMSKASLAATIVSVVLLVAFLFSFVASSPVVVRVQNGASSDNFKINGAMVDYFASSYVESWYQEYLNGLYQTYGDYYQLYLQYGLIDGFDPQKPYDEQFYDKNAGITYADFFVEGAELYLAKILRYCEAAKADTEIDFAALEAEVKTEVKDTMKGLDVAAKLYGMTTKDYIRSYFGKNMSKNDLEKCLILEKTAGKYSDIMYERVFDNMEDGRKTEFFNKNLNAFVSAGYLTYSLSQPETVTFPVAADYDGGEESKAYKAAKEAIEKENSSITNEEDKKPLPNVEDYVGGENSVAYKAEYAKAEDKKLANEKQMIVDKQIMDKLTTAKSEKEFKTIVLESIYDKNFQSAYDSIASKLGESAPTEAELAEFKASVKDSIINATLEGLSDIVTDSANTETETEETEWEKQQKTLPASVISKLSSVLNSMVKTTNYSLATDLGIKLFSGVKAQYGVDYKPYETEGTNAVVGDVWYVDGLVSNKNSVTHALNIYQGMLNEEDADKEAIEGYIEDLNETLKERETAIEDASKTGTYTYIAYFVTEAAHRDDAKIRNVGHILFSVDTTGKDTKAYKTSEEAEKAAQLLLDTIKKDAADGLLNKEKFEEHAAKTHDSNVFYEDVYKGQMVSEFEDWLFAAEEEGKLGLVETDFGWHIMYYMGEGAEAGWQYTAHLAATNEDLSEWFEALTYEVNVNSQLLEKFYK